MRTASALLLALFATGCAPPAGEPAPAAAPVAAAVTDLDPPAAAGSFAPSLAAAGDTFLLTWLERLDPERDGARHRVRFSRLAGDVWSAPATVAEGSDFFANWADFPTAAESPEGDLYVHWLAKTGDETYAYSIFVARSADGGLTWEPLGRLNDDDTPTEHGFVSYAPGGGVLRAFWLDGRAMMDGGPMALRAASLGSLPAAGEVLDDRVCECCQTDAAPTAGGSVVVYRDRSEGEVRDIYIVRRQGEGWSAPRPVHEDGWKIEGCPVNGPAVDAEGNALAVAWFTAAAASPRVQVAFSADGGAGFGPPVLVDGDAPLGRVDVVLDRAGSAVVSWLGTAGQQAGVRVRRVSPDGSAGEPLTVAETGAARASGFPRLARAGERILVAWVETAGDETGSRIHVRRLALGDPSPRI